MKKFLNFTIFILLLVVLLFASCKKEKEAPVTVSQNTGSNTGTGKVIKEIIFSNLIWGLDTIRNVLTTKLSIPSNFSVDSILVVYGGSQSRIIPNNNNDTLSSGLYYKTVNSEVTIYHSYSGTFPDRNSFPNPVAYGIAHAIFLAESIDFGWVKVVFR